MILFCHEILKNTWGMKRTDKDIDVFFNLRAINGMG